MLKHFDGLDWCGSGLEQVRCCCEHVNEPWGSVKFRDSLWLAEGVFSLPKGAVLHEVSFGGKNKESFSQGKSYPCRDGIRVSVRLRGNNRHWDVMSRVRLHCRNLTSSHSSIHGPAWLGGHLTSRRAGNAYEVCSNSIRIGVIVVVHWVGCVCNQSWHVRTCLSNSWHKLQLAAFAQLAVVGRGSNTCVYVIASFTMCESTGQRICIKFCFKIGKTATETYQLLQQAYGEEAMGRTQVFDGFRCFKEGRTSVESDPRSGRPSTSRNEEMIAKVRIIVPRVRSRRADN